MEAARQAGVTGVHVLDVGGGIGAIAHELLSAGAAYATVVEASAAYLAAAREEAERRGWKDRLDLVPGDFVSIAANVPAGDIVTLDKVVCCYPNMDDLLSAVTDHTRRALGIVYPRDGWWVRLSMAFVNVMLSFRRGAFRVYVFPNAAIDSRIQRAGLARRFERRGFLWVVALYERPTRPA
ncbi:MAG: methyltransferase domain-containing protein [Gemmatimonadaceae bacterium]